VAPGFSNRASVSFLEQRSPSVTSPGVIAVGLPFGSPVGIDWRSLLCVASATAVHSVEATDSEGTYSHSHSLSLSLSSGDQTL